MMTLQTGGGLGRVGRLAVNQSLRLVWSSGSKAKQPQRYALSLGY